MRGAAAQVDPKAGTVQDDLPFENKDIPEVEADKEVEVDTPEVEKKEPETVPSVDALQKQIQDLEKAEQTARDARDAAIAEREAALADRQKFETEATKSKLSVEQAQLETIETAISAAQADADAAQRDIKTAIINADPDAQTEAYRRLAKAETYLGRLEDGKGELEARVARAKALAEKPPEVEKKATDPVEALNLPDRAKEWLRERPEYINDQRKNVKLQAAHWDAIEEGHKPFSTDYFISVEKILGLRKAEPTIEEREVERPITPDQQRRTAIVSAPVSRDPPSGGEKKSSTRVTLTKAEQEHAKAAGITEAEYAKQKLKLQDLKQNGHYGEH